MSCQVDDDTPCPICRKVFGKSDLGPIQQMTTEMTNDNRKLKKKIKFANARCSFYMRQHLDRKNEVKRTQKRLEEVEASNNRRVQQLEESYQRKLRKMQQQISVLRKLIPVITLD